MGPGIEILVKQTNPSTILIPASSEEVVEGDSVEITKTFITIGLRPNNLCSVILRNSEQKAKCPIPDMNLQNSVVMHLGMQNTKGNYRDGQG